MPIPSLTIEDIKVILPQISEIGNPKVGGQKIVFPCQIDGGKYVVKFLLANPPSSSFNEEQSLDILDEVTERARREVGIMQQCASPFLVKLGPIPLTSIEYNSQKLLFFTEEYIDGDDLKELLNINKTLSISDLILLGRNITEAIRVLWLFSKVHRDIKPANIMKRSETGEFILLDMGMAFDLTEESLTQTGVVVGTVFYFSPDQIDYPRKRQLDFRSDLFSLGVVMYQAATGIHPFISRGSFSTTNIIGNILTSIPIPPINLRPDLPKQLNDLILRLLAKKPHLRYRTCEQLDKVLAAINIP